MRGVIASIVLVLVVQTAPAAAQKPWETRLDLRVPVPVDMPALQPANPFAAAVVTPPMPRLTPLAEKYVGVFSIQTSAYIDASGVCQRVVFLRTPWPAVTAETQTVLTETTFAPARAAGAPVATWLPIGIDLNGRIDEGRVIRVQPSTPDPAAPPAVERITAPVPQANDLALPATRVEQLEVAPQPKRFRAKLGSRAWQQPIRLLAEVATSGRCERVVLLSCPEGLAPWLLASLASWTFAPAQGPDGPVMAWVQLDLDIAVEVGSLSADALRLSRVSMYPFADAQPAGAPLPGA
jgi:hypothetical protein